MFGFLFLPLFTCVLCGLFMRNVDKNFSAYITSFGVFIAFCVSGFAFYLTAFKKEVIDISLFNFFVFSNFSTEWSIYIDSLTATMLFVVTFVSLLVHIYSIGYMHDDENQPKFMAFLSLFTFFMLVLVTAKDFIQLFVGWEGVGLCSYLLIGFWNEKESANLASIKAFITNRVSDLALIVGICGIYYLFGSFEFKAIHAGMADHIGEHFSIFGIELEYITLIAICLFIGCMGKSAQLFLHVWLPDAMEGPTPVSALIHAATMVTAGVFLLSRASFIFEYSPQTQTFIIFIGSLTALFAATIALTQNDIKKIIAYSTCSQLGYMMVASGFSAYNAGIFHLATHAFFKALLFLSAGSVIHAMSGEQDINKMGGLAKKIPVTFYCMLIGSVAIAGIPPLAGFFSKDAIIESAFLSSHPLNIFSFCLLVVSAFITSFYSWRLIILTFGGKEVRNTKDVINHIHESPKVMLIPLILLSIFAIFSGIILEYTFHILSSENGIFAKSIFVLQGNDILSKLSEISVFVKFTPTILSIVAICFAYWFFAKKRQNYFPKFIINLVSNKYYFDEIYKMTIVKLTHCISTILIKFVDKKIIDFSLTEVATRLVNLFAFCSSRIQNGKVVQYFALMFITITLTFYFVIYKNFI